MKGIEQGLHYYSSLEISVAWTMHFYEVLKQVPVLQNPIFSTLSADAALQCHRRASGTFQPKSESSAPCCTGKRSARPAQSRMAEQALLQIVRTGDLNYSQALSASMGISAGVLLESEDALRQSKTSIIVFTSIVCRAAIEGGLFPDESYSLGDSYIQSAHTSGELKASSRMMYDDFIHRVHKCRTNPKLSRQIQQCVDYIEMHLDQKILASDLAKQVSHTEYYLTYKFKAETGLSVTDYTKFAKTERVKVLLKSTDRTVQEIAEQLGFDTRNYFSRVFQQVTGKTPVEYRES